MQHSLKWSGLQARMTISYVWVTIVAVFLLEILIFGILAAPIFDGRQQLSRVQQAAYDYAARVSTTSTGMALDPSFSFTSVAYASASSLNSKISNQPSIAITYISGLLTLKYPVALALLITPNMQIFATTYPQRYPVGTSITGLLSRNNAQLIARAMQGAPASDACITPSGRASCAAQPVWSKTYSLIGVVYVQAPQTEAGWPSLLQLAGSLLGSGILLLLVTVPVGTLFGIITTRGLVRRLRHLANASTMFADGNYTQRVRVMRKDEVGQLEQQFNRMAEQLVTSIATRQQLAEENARLAERSRISRELHDAISQDLFSLSMLAGGLQAAIPDDSPLHRHSAILERTTTNVIREMRTLLLELRPTQLEHLGLAQALEDSATAYSSRLGITITTDITPVQLCPKAQHTLLRIAQETLANAARHANASTISISRVPLEASIKLIIADDGKGFSEDGGNAHQLGLRLMQERTQELNGSFLLQTSPGQGTCIQVYIPMEPAL